MKRRPIEDLQTDSSYWHNLFLADSMKKARESLETFGFILLIISLILFYSFEVTINTESFIEGTCECSTISTSAYRYGFVIFIGIVILFLFASLKRFKFVSTYYLSLGLLSLLNSIWNYFLGYIGEDAFRPLNMNILIRVIIGVWMLFGIRNPNYTLLISSLGFLVRIISSMSFGNTFKNEFLVNALYVACSIWMSYHEETWYLRQVRLGIVPKDFAFEYLKNLQDAVFICTPDYFCIFQNEAARELLLSSHTYNINNLLKYMKNKKNDKYLATYIDKTFNPSLGIEKSYTKLFSTWSLQNATYKIHIESVVIEETRAASIQVKMKNVKNMSVTKKQLILKDIINDNIEEKIRTPLQELRRKIEILLHMPESLVKENLRGFKRIIEIIITKVKDYIDIKDFITKSFSLVYSRFSLKKLVRRLTMLCNYRLRRRTNINFILSVDPDLGDIIYSDYERLFRLLINLLFNSINHTESGYIKLSISKIFKSPNIKFEIADTGKGGVEAINQLEEMLFVNLDKKTGLKNIELYISQKLAESLKTNLIVSVDTSANERDNSGKTQVCIINTLSFVLPIEPYVEGAANSNQEIREIQYLQEQNEVHVLSAHRQICIHNDEIPNNQFMDSCSYNAHRRNKRLELYTILKERPKQMLIVDDDHISRFVLRSFLEKYPLSLSYASNGKEALEMAKQKINDEDHIDFVILMDLAMPVMDGIESAIAIRNYTKKNSYFDTKYPLIVAATAVVLESEIQHCRKAGMNGFISKPITPDSIKRLLEFIMEPTEFTYF